MVSNEIINGYLQLGIAGATLLILLIFFVMQSKDTSKRDTNNSDLVNLQFTKMDKLCDKIDALITSNGEYTQELNKVLLCNDKDQKETLKLLSTILDINMDMQKRVVRIDDRTYACLSPKQISKEG